MALSVFSIPVYATAQSHTNKNANFRIGVMLSLSGGLEQWCNYIRQGVELAASEYKDSGVEIILEDDGSVDKRVSLSAAHKLIDRDKVHALISWSLSNSAILAPVVKRAHIPLFVGAYDKRLSSAGNYVFGGIVNYELIARNIAQFFKAINAKRVALVLASDDWSMSFKDPFSDEAMRLGLDIVYSETIAATETETRSIVSKLKHNKVDAVLAPLYGNALFSFIRRHREMKVPGTINVGDGMFEGDIKILGRDAEGVTAIQIWLESPEFIAKLSRYNGAAFDPLQLGLVASGYDSVLHLVKAVDHIRSQGLEFSGDSLNATLQSFKSTGYLGEQMLGAPPVKAGARITVIKNGRYQLPSASQFSLIK